MQTYMIRTFGCQMNKHDSERVAGMLDERGMQCVHAAEEADVIVFMTCCVRENADERLLGQVASLKALKHGHQGPLIAVGGCIGQRDGETLLKQLPHLDVVFGTHNVGSLPSLLDAASEMRTAQIEVLESASADFTTDLPSSREHPWHAWVPITVGCDNFCTYCVVPYVRGRERSRPIEDVVSEVSALVQDGVKEITLLGQNVNSYGRDLYGEPRFHEVLRAVANTGIARIRFATSHPKDLSTQTIEAMATLPAVMPYLHLPIQSGSDQILKRMNRHYTRADYLALVSTLRSRIPGLALSTDVIVGFPGETEEDFDATLQLVEQVGFTQAFTFIYSPREGTPAATMDGKVDREVTQRRFDRLVDAVQASALATSLPYMDTVQTILVEGSSKRNERVLMGRTTTNRVVHAPLREGASIDSYVGRFIQVHITDVQTWFLAGEIMS